jgi:hypothetical protein
MDMAPEHRGAVRQASDIARPSASAHRDRTVAATPRESHEKAIRRRVNHKRENDVTFRASRQNIPDF